MTEERLSMNGKNKKCMQAAVLSVLLLPLQTLPIRMETASAISVVSGAAACVGCTKLLENYYDGAVFWGSAALILLGGCIVPGIALSYTPTARLLNAKMTLRGIRNKEIVGQSSLNKADFYHFIDTFYAHLSWPLMGAKDDLKKYFSELDSVCKELKKAVAEVKKGGQKWPEGASFLRKIEQCKTHVTDLLRLINEHPDYQKLVCEYENKKSLDDLAASIRYQTSANVHYCIN